MPGSWCAWQGARCATTPTRWTRPRDHTSGSTTASTRQSRRARASGNSRGEAAESAAKSASKPLNRKAGLTSSRKGGEKTAQVRPTSLIVGFDCEWVTEDDRNLVLSYQVACRYGDTEWTCISYTRAAARIRYPEATEEWIAENARDRCKFADLIAAAISVGVRRRLIRTWPKSLVACAHW